MRTLHMYMAYGMAEWLAGLNDQEKHLRLNKVDVTTHNSLWCYTYRYLDQYNTFILFL